MNTNHREPGRSGTCQDYRAVFQDYLDGALPKTESLSLFLHLRDCPDCQSELDQMKGVLDALEALPEAEVPVDFNDRIMASIPLQAYRDMEPLRRDRVPVIFEEEFLPAFVRAGSVRMASGFVGAVALAGVLTSLLPDAAVGLTVLGVLPEVLVRLQGFGRRMILAEQRSDSG